MKLSKIALSLAMVGAVQAASAGVITVIVDDFNTAGVRPFVASNGSLTFGVVDSTTGVGFVGNNANGVFSVNAGSFIGGSGTLTYTPGVVLPANALGATLNYSMVFSNLGNPNPPPILNIIEANGTTTNYGAVGGLSGNPAISTAVAYTSGDNIVLKFVDNRAVSWDLAIDNVGVSFVCNSVADKTYTSISDYTSVLRGQGIQCVPEPGSMALLGLGGIAAAFAARRRIFK